MQRQEIIFEDLGRMGYHQAWDYQEKLMQQNLAIKSEHNKLGLETVPQTQHHLLFVEHDPVYTLGKSGSLENVLLSDQQMSERGIEFFRTNRGGDITFHGPQQIVGYPILDLEKFDTDIGKYMRNLEQVIIQTLNYYGINAGRSTGETGVWIDSDIKGKERKIAALGVRCSRWITMHGFALNVNTDLTYFRDIVACGIPNKQVTSMEKELGHIVPIDSVKKKLKQEFEKVFDAELVDKLVLTR